MTDWSAGFNSHITVVQSGLILRIVHLLDHFLEDLLVLGHSRLLSKESLELLLDVPKYVLAIVCEFLLNLWLVEDEHVLKDLNIGSFTLDHVLHVESLEDLSPLDSGVVKGPVCHHVLRLSSLLKVFLPLVVLFRLGRTERLRFEGVVFLKLSSSNAILLPRLVKLPVDSLSCL